MPRTRYRGRRLALAAASLVSVCLNVHTHRERDHELALLLGLVPSHRDGCRGVLPVWVLPRLEPSCRRSLSSSGGRRMVSHHRLIHEDSYGDFGWCLKRVYI